MKNWSNNNADYYGTGSRYGNSTSRSGHDKRQNMSLSKVSDAKSKFDTRIQKACPTNSIQAYKKEVYLLKKELQRLEKQSLKKDNRIFELQSSHNVVRQLQSELQETYRIIYLYEGKIQELQKELKRLQNKIADHLESSLSPTDMEALLNEYRDDNTEMRGALESQNRIIMELEEKLRTIESKYFQTEWKLSSQNRIIQNPLKKKFPKLRDTIVIQEISLAERQKMINEIQNKYQEINKEIDPRFTQNSKNLQNNKTYGKKKLLAQSKDTQEFQDNKIKGVLETPRSAKIATVYTPKMQSSQNQTMGKVKSSAKVDSIKYAQQWENSKQQRKNGNYQFYRNLESKKNSWGGSQSQNASLNYSLSDGPLVSETKISQNGLSSQYFGSDQTKYISSQSNQNIQTRNGSNVRILSLSNANKTFNQSPYKNYESYSNTTNLQKVQSSHSPSSKIIRISRQQPKQQYSQNSYYSYGSNQQTPNNKNTRYIIKPS